MNNIFDELIWRGCSLITPKVFAIWSQDEKITVYNGFDPTGGHPAYRPPGADDGPGPLAAFWSHAHRRRRRRHGMIGDPSGKSEERNLLTSDEIEP